MTGVVLELALVEAANLAAIVDQLAELLAETEGDDATTDPAIARLVPDGYRDDPASSDEFRRLTEGDLLDRRRADAALVLRTLERAGAGPRLEGMSEDDAGNPVEVILDDAAVAAWLRVLTAVRLVLATRLGIDDDRDDLDHPRYGVYNWLGYRLEHLLQAIDA